LSTPEDRGRVLVVVELSSAPPAGPLVEVHPGVRVACDLDGNWVRLEVRGVWARVGPDLPAPAAASPQAGADLDRTAPGTARPGPEPAPEPPVTAAPAAAAAGQTGAPGDRAQADANGHGGRPEGPVTVYSDGGCLGNPGPGGWAARLKYANGRTVELGGAQPHTTNNRMELTAAIEGLRRAQTCSPVTVVTDSEYLRRGITEWIGGWKRRGWLTAAKEPVLNQDLWQELDRLNRPDVRWRHTRGHAGDPDNERCDRLAREFASGRRPSLAGQ
jgi:ribonuclease HI